MRKGIIALEEQVGPIDPDATSIEDAALAKDLGDNNLGAVETSIAIDQLVDHIDNAQNVSAALGTISDHVAAADELGGMSAGGTAALNVAVEHLYRSIGAKKSQTISFESHSGKKMNRAALEGIKQFASDVWEAIKAAFRKLVEYISRFISFIFGTSKNNEQKLDNTKEKIKELEQVSKNGKYTIRELDQKITHFRHTSGTVNKNGVNVNSEKFHAEYNGLSGEEAIIPRAAVMSVFRVAELFKRGSLNDVTSGRIKEFEWAFLNGLTLLGKIDLSNMIKMDASEINEQAFIYIDNVLNSIANVSSEINSLRVDFRHTEERTEFNSKEVYVHYPLFGAAAIHFREGELKGHFVSSVNDVKEESDYVIVCTESEASSLVSYVAGEGSSLRYKLILDMLLKTLEKMLKDAEGINEDTPGAGAIGVILNLIAFATKMSKEIITNREYLNSVLLTWVAKSVEIRYDALLKLNKLNKEK